MQDLGVCVKKKRNVMLRHAQNDRCPVKDHLSTDDSGFTYHTLTVCIWYRHPQSQENCLSWQMTTLLILAIPRGRGRPIFAKPVVLVLSLQCTFFTESVYF